MPFDLRTGAWKTYGESLKPSRAPAPGIPGAPGPLPPPPPVGGPPPPPAPAIGGGAPPAPGIPGAPGRRPTAPPRVGPQPITAQAIVAARSGPGVKPGLGALPAPSAGAANAPAALPPAQPLSIYQLSQTTSPAGVQPQRTTGPAAPPPTNPAAALTGAPAATSTSSKMSVPYSAPAEAAGQAGGGSGYSSAPPYDAPPGQEWWLNDATGPLGILNPDLDPNSPWGWNLRPVAGAAPTPPVQGGAGSRKGLPSGAGAVNLSTLLTSPERAFGLAESPQVGGLAQGVPYQPFRMETGYGQGQAANPIGTRQGLVDPYSELLAAARFGRTPEDLVREQALMGRNPLLTPRR